MAGRTRADKTAADSAASSPSAATSSVSSVSSATEAVTREQGAGRVHTLPQSETSEEGVILNCLMNARYHSAREAFLDAVHRWFMFGIIIAGAGAVSGLFEQLVPNFNIICGTIAAVLGAADLAFDLSNRARAHALMKRRFFELLSDLRDGQKTIAHVEACAHRYSADEEPAYHALLMGSWNAAQRSVYGDRAELLEIPLLHRLLQNFWRFEGRDYPIVEDHKQAA